MAQNTTSEAKGRQFTLKKVEFDRPGERSPE